MAGIFLDKNFNIFFKSLLAFLIQDNIDILIYKIICE